MPKTLKIKTDLGEIAFGAVLGLEEENYNPRKVKQVFTGTDLIKFFGHPARFPDSPTVWKTATLANGNKIVCEYWGWAPNSVAMSLSYISGGQEQVTGGLIMDNYQGAFPPMYLAQANKVKFSDGTPVEWGLISFKNNDGGSINGDNDKPPYTISKYGFGDVLFGTIGKLEGLYGTSIAWLSRFIEGSIVPNFPGPDNENDPEGGDGEGPEGIEDDPIEFPEKPGITVTDAGLMTLYTPTQGQIHAFGDFLWSDGFSLDTFKKLFADPMQAVIGLSIVPVAVPTAGAQPITIGAISSGVTANRAASQYVVHDCGTLKVNPVWNTALDFSPYTKFSIYLPFIGTRELKTDDIMGKELNVKYFVDVLSGACTAHISVGGSVLYQFSGSCATPVPLSAMNWNSTLTSMIQLAGAGIAMAVTGGAAAPAAAGMLTTATGMIGNKPNVQRSGAVSGAAGMLGVKTPYLIRETPRQSLAKDYAHYSGYPSNITAVLGTLKGFTMVENMHLKNIDATADELDEIETALKEGVIL